MSMARNRAGLRSLHVLVYTAVVIFFTRLFSSCPQKYDQYSKDQFFLPWPSFLLKPSFYLSQEEHQHYYPSQEKDTQGVPLHHTRPLNLQNTNHFWTSIPDEDYLSWYRKLRFQEDKLRPADVRGGKSAHNLSVLLSPACKSSKVKSGSEKLTVYVKSSSFKGFDRRTWIRESWAATHKVIFVLLTKG